MKKLYSSRISTLTPLLILIGLAGCQTVDPLTQPSHTAQAVPPATQPAGSSGQSLRSSLLKLVSGYEYSPKAEDFRGLGTPSQVVAAIIALYGDSQVATTRRTRALRGLLFFDRPKAQSTLEAVLRDPETPNLTRRAMVRVYALKMGAAGLALLGEMVAHSDRHTRDIAVRAVSRLGAAEATQILEGRVSSEPDKAIRGRVEQELSRRSAK